MSLGSSRYLATTARTQYIADNSHLEVPQRGPCMVPPSSWRWKGSITRGGVLNRGPPFRPCLPIHGGPRPQAIPKERTQRWEAATGIVPVPTHSLSTSPLIPPPLVDGNISGLKAHARPEYRPRKPQDGMLAPPTHPCTQLTPPSYLRQTFSSVKTTLFKLPALATRPFSLTP